jgi:hypothetical protein
MLSFTGALRVFVALEPCDMRKGFDGLSGMVASKLNEDLQSGALFVFTNRSHTRLKIICWDGSGLWLITKRLEKGTFSCPRIRMAKPNSPCELRRWPCSPTGLIYEAGGCGHGISAKSKIFSYLFCIEHSMYFMSIENQQTPAAGERKAPKGK